MTLKIYANLALVTRLIRQFTLTFSRSLGLQNIDPNFVSFACQYRTVTHDMLIVFFYVPTQSTIVSLCESEIKHVYHQTKCNPLFLIIKNLLQLRFLMFTETKFTIVRYQLLKVIYF